MDKDSSVCKRKKSIEDSLRGMNKCLKTGSASDEEDEDLFSWEEYLKKCHAKAVPKETFKHVQETKVQGFVPGMKLESLDRTSLETDTYWVATVVMSSGPLLLLRYDGYDDDRSGDFWCDAASEDLQPIGWCARTNNILIPPAAIRHKGSNWAKFLMQDLKNAVCAPDHLFHRRSDPDDENHLKPGLKLELLHLDDPLCYWVASVVDAFGLRLRLRLEGSFNDSDDIWVYFLSDNVHQLGFGKEHNLRLDIPSALKTKYPNEDWAQVQGRMLGLVNLSTEDDALNRSLNKSQSLPKPHNFKTGMKLEAVNPKDPSSICAATISKVANEIFFQVEIDSMIECGEGDKPSMWCSSNSRNIFPVEWCKKNNIQLTPPPGYLIHPFSWTTYLEWTNSSAAPDSLFDLDIPPHEFDIGMKFEAVDQTDPSIMTVASVTQVVGRTMWVLLDGFKDDSVEHIYDVESFDLFPVGWCSMNGHPLLAPRIQRPPEENRRLASLRITKQRENKKSTADTEVSNTTNTSNTLSDIADDLSTTNVNSSEKVEGKTILESDIINAASVVVTNQSSIPVISKDLEPVVKLETTAIKEEKHIAVKEKKHEEPRRREVLEKIPSTPKGKYDLRASTLIARDYWSKEKEEKEDEEDKKKGNVEAVIDLTEDEDIEQRTEICIFVRNKCEQGPFLNKSKLANVPAVIGPADPTIVLTQLLEQILPCADSPKEVVKLFACETKKRTISSIVKTLKIKLSLCENLISLNRVARCMHCDIVKAPLTKQLGSPRKLEFPKDVGKLTSTPMSGSESHVTRNVSVVRSYLLEPPKTAPLDAATLPTSKHITKWTVSDVADYIKSTDCHRFAENFMKQEIDGRALSLLSLDEIHKCLGVTLGPAIKLQNSVQSLLKKNQ